MLGADCSQCCDKKKDPCDPVAPLDRLRITFDGLPSDCARSSSTYGYEYALREYSDWNGCSFHAFRIYKYGAPLACEYRAQLPLATNERLFCLGGGLLVTLNLATDTLYINLGVGGVTVGLKPETGKSFRDVPYSGGVVVQSAPTPCPAAKWSAVTVSIDDGGPTFRPIQCPDATRDQNLVGVDSQRTSTCQSPADLHPAATQPGSKVQYESCDVCDPQAFGSYTPVAPDPNVVIGHDEINVNVTISEMSVTPLRVSIHGAPVLLPSSFPGYASMSKTYALKYNTTAYNYATPVSLNNDDYSGTGAAVLSQAGCGWAGRFYGSQGSAPIGDPPLDQPGYITFREHPTTVGLYQQVLYPAVIEMAVVPVGFHVPYDRAARRYVYSACNAGTYAHQVRVRLWWREPILAFGRCYFSVPCAAQTCRKAPRIAVTETVYDSFVPVYVPGLGAPLYTTGSFTVSISSA
jgi:hypothetical protein